MRPGGTPARTATIAAIFVAFYALASTQARGAGLPRATQDRPDELTGSQVHLMYVLPSDGNDRQLDTNGTLEGSASSFQAWLRGETGGRDLDIDMVLDVGKDDYFEHSIPGCIDLADSGYMEGGTEAPGPKSVSLSASRGKVRFGKRVTLSASVSPCPGHEGDTIEFYKGSTLITGLASDPSCAASLSVKMRKAATFKAVSPQQDSEHTAGESAGLRVKVKY